MSQYILSEYELELKRDQKAWIIIQNGMIRHDLIRTCTNCEDWNKDDQICKIYKMLPPAEVIVTGCEEWSYNIPF